MATKIYLFDWGDTLMVDFKGVPGKMCDWDHVEATPFAKQALEKLSKTAQIYIATAAAQSSPKDIEKAFERVGLSDYITGYFCRQNTGFTKPDPLFYQTIFEKLNVLPHQVTMVGDTLENDILPCLELGCHTVWLDPRGGHETMENVRVVQNLGELQV